MEDAQIVTLFLDRDEGGIQAAADKYGSRLRQLGFRLLPDRLTVEECENDAYLLAWDSIPPHQPRDYLFPFLARLMRHTVLDRCRALTRRRQIARLTALTRELEDCLPTPDHTQALVDALALGDGGTENKVCSPLNIYFALGMLAELTDGSSRQQILDLLGHDSIDTLRAQARALWNANYNDDGMLTSVLASSLWLNEDVPFVQSTLDTLADTYYASSYQGEMGSAQLDQALQAWLNDQTGGLLKEAAGQVRLEPETVLALATTVYYQGRWAQEFNPDNTAPDTFHSPEGDVTCDFMHSSSSNNYYWGDQFSAVGRSVLYGGTLWMVLPDEGVSVDQLLADPEAMAFLLSNGEWENQKYLRVNLSMPKFDVSGQLDLIQGLQAMGITDVFDPAVSDFTPMTTELDEIYVTQATHAARVAVDEEGVTAAAFTAMAMGGSGMPEDEVDFTLDRPFLFVLTSSQGQPLFAGVVNQPA